jgi:hypothetical protein
MCSPATLDDDDRKIARLFACENEKWRSTYDALVDRLAGLGPDLGVVPADGHVNLLRGTRRFAVVQPCSGGHLDIGIRLRGVATTARFEAAGAWNATVTHRVRIEDAKEVDAQVLAWLRWAYAAAAGE